MPGGAGGIIDFMIAASRNKRLADDFCETVKDGNFQDLKDFLHSRGYVYVDDPTIHTILVNKRLYKGNIEVNPVVPLY